MKLFTIYDPATGKVARSGFVLNDADADLQNQSGEALLVGTRAKPETEKVDVSGRTPVIVQKTGADSQ